MTKPEFKFKSKRQKQKVFIEEEIKQKCIEALKYTDYAQALLDLFRYFSIRYKEEELKEIPLYIIFEDGKSMGNIIDNKLPEFLTKYSIFTFVHGGVYDVDNVNKDNPYYSCEGKSSTGNFPVGAKTNAGLEKKSDNIIGKYIENEDGTHFCTFVSYRIDKENHDYFIQDIWLGIIKPSDWKYSSSKASGSANISSKVFYRKFLKIYDWQKGKLYN